MTQLYMDNAATSFPKPPEVINSISNYLTYRGSSISRSTSNDNYKTENIVYETRLALSNLFGAQDARYVTFTKNITESLNIILFGLLNNGDHVIISSLEHNAIMRPLNALKENNISYTEVSPDINGNFNIADLETAKKPNTKLIIMLHGSNVFGTILDLKTVGTFAKKNNLYFCIDSAQTAGHIPITLDDFSADAIAFTGHKGLLGPTGIGGLILKKDFAQILRPLIYGGTGSASDKDFQPNSLPDKFESGTPNIVGIIGLNEGLKYIQQRSLSSIHKHELSLIYQLISELETIDAINIIGPSSNMPRTSVLAFDVNNFDNAIFSHILASEYGITNRCGMHCAPHAHKWGGTFPQGVVRLSCGAFQNSSDIDFVAHAVKSIINNHCY